MSENAKTQNQQNKSDDSANQQSDKNIDSKGNESTDAKVITDLKKELETTKQQLSELKSSVLSDDYMRYMSSILSSEQLKSSQKQQTSEDTGDVDNMTQKQLLTYLIGEIGKRLPDIIDNHLYTKQVETVKKQLQQLNQSNSDWSDYKLEMKVLSEEHPDWDVLRLYNEAKKWRTPVVPKTVNTEKPLLSSYGGYEQYKQSKGSDAAKDAIKEMQELLNKTSDIKEE